MIKIVQDIPTKTPGMTSLYVSFEYNPDIVSILKNVPTHSYNPKTKVWEVPNTELKFLLDSLCLIDDISLDLYNFSDNDEHNSVEQSEFKTKPFEYQMQGIEYGINHKNWLLLDQPGLGKTLQTLYTAQWLKEKCNISHCLIVCGVNTLKLNWKKEIEKHTNLSCRILGEYVTKRGNKKIGTVAQRLEQLKNPIEEFFVITNIETLRNDAIVKEIMSEKVNVFDMCIVDEIHCCKSPTSTQGKHLLKMNKFPYKIGCSGTPLLNSPLDCFVPLKWVGAENGTYTNFKYYYCEYGGKFNNILLSYRNMGVLKEQLEKYSLRRTKDILKLPPKTVINEYVEMNDDQQTFYENIKNGIVDQVDKVGITTTSLLGMLTRLRQASSCPTALTTEQISNAKLDRVCDLVMQTLANDEKVVVLSMYKETVNELSKLLKDYDPLICTGDIHDDIISYNIQQFQEDNSHKVMLCTISKMGTGVTLTAARTAIFVDCSWTKAINLQCEDRIHRIGSDTPVFIYYLWNSGTVDERVKEVVDDKQMMSDYVIDDTINPRVFDRLRNIVLDLQQT